MIRFVFLACSSIFFLGCSFNTPPNAWQHKSASAFHSYTQNFLQGHEALARNDLDRARSHAKMSADLSQLARIELGKCALHIAVGIDDTCLEYVALEEIVDSAQLDAYYALLRKRITKEQIAYLDDSYSTFAQAYRIGDYKEAIAQLHAIEKPSSKIIAAALIQKHLSYEEQEQILSFVSFYGYKKAAIFWLKSLLKQSDGTQKSLLSKKLQILQERESHGH